MRGLGCHNFLHIPEPSFDHRFVPLKVRPARPGLRRPAPISVVAAGPPSQSRYVAQPMAE